MALNLVVRWLEHMESIGRIFFALLFTMFVLADSSALADDLEYRVEFQELFESVLSEEQTRTCLDISFEKCSSTLSEAINACHIDDYTPVILALGVMCLSWLS